MMKKYVLWDQQSYVNISLCPELIRIFKHKSTTDMKNIVIRPKQKIQYKLYQILNKTT